MLWSPLFFSLSFFLFSFPSHLLTLMAFVTPSAVSLDFLKLGVSFLFSLVEGTANPDETVQDYRSAISFRLAVPSISPSFCFPWRRQS